MQKSTGSSANILVDRFIGSTYDKVIAVYANLQSVVNVSSNLENIEVTNELLPDIKSIVEGLDKELQIIGSLIHLEQVDKFNAYIGTVETVDRLIDVEDKDEGSTYLIEGTNNYWIFDENRTPVDMGDILSSRVYLKRVGELILSSNSQEGLGSRVETLELSKNSLTEDIVLLRAKDTVLNQSIISLQAKNNIVDQEIVALQTKDTSTEEDITSLQEKDISLDEDITSLQEKDISLEEGITSLQVKDTSLEQDITSLQAKDNSLDQDIILLKAKDTSISQSILSLQSQNTDVSNLEQDITTLEESTTTIVEDMDGLRQAKVILNNRLDTLQLDVLNIDNEVSGLLQADMATNTSIQNLELEDTGIKASIASIEAQIQALQSSSGSGSGAVTTAWTDLTYNTYWVNYGGSYINGQYRKVGDVVELRGLIKRNEGSLDIICTLPVGFRPIGSCSFYNVGSGWKGRLDIKSNGNILNNVADNGYISLDGASFSTIS